MSLPENFSPDESSSSPIQRIAIGIGTLVVITLMVLAAIFLAREDIADESTPVAANTPTIILPTSTPVQGAAASPTPVPPTHTLTPTQMPSATPIPTLTFTPVSEATPTASEATPTDTPTQETVSTETATAAPEVPTATEPPAVEPPTATSPPDSGGICTPPASWVEYAVQIGDTLNSLAERTDSTVFDLQQVNCLDSFTIRPGQVIYLPFTPPTPTATGTPTPVTPTPTATRTSTPSPTPRAPEIFSNDPNAGAISVEITLAVQGRYFRPDEDGFRVELRTGGIKYELQLGELRTATSFEAVIPAGLLEPGTYDLWVINPDDQFDTRRSAYTALNE